MCSGGVIGPELITAVLKQDDFAHLRPYAQPIVAFYPVRWQEWYKLFIETDNPESIIPDRAFAVHLWNEIIRKSGVVENRNRLYSDQTTIGLLQRRFL